MWKTVVTPTALVSLLWLAVGSATLYYMNWVYQSHARELAENFTTIQAADSMQDVLWRLQATAMEVVERADSHTRIEVTELEEAFAAHLAEAEAGCATPEARSLIKTIRDQFARYRQYIHRRLDLPSTVGSPGPPSVEMAQFAHTIAESCKSLLRVQEQLVAESTAQRSRLRIAFDQVMIILWIAGPTVGILSGLWIARGLRRSISQISISLKDAAGGLEHAVGRVEVHPSDDLPALQEQVHLVSSRIQEVVDQLQQARRETMLADRLAAVGEMAAGVAHELRNPLTSVKLLIQAAADTPPDHALSDEHIHVVLEQIVRMEGTIQGLLDFARPPQMQMVRHDVRETLRRALNLVEGHAKQQDVVVSEDYPNAPVLVDGDPEQLHQVFVNLLLNGVESMPEGGELKVAIPCGDVAGDSCRIVFSDTGTGIPPPIMDRLFEPFVTNKLRGTGLGLAISRRIVEQHGGKLTAANRDDGGAEFTVELPLDAGRRGGPLAQGCAVVLGNTAVDASRPEQRWEASHA
jgi:two-component system, NtrC family, sensor histidine kinase HydH